MKLILVLLLGISLACSSDASMCRPVRDIVIKFLFKSDDVFREEADHYGSGKAVEAALTLKGCAGSFSDEEKVDLFNLVENLLSNC